jgi:aspartate/methionine/tyrosine aminotransferase
VDYASFRRFRDELLRTRSPLRLDCMNPAKALAAWGPPPLPEGAHQATRSESDALAAWSATTGIRPEAAWVGAGVRDLLERVLPALDALVDEFWCPEDVYPVYAEILGARTRREYRTIPQVEWGRLAEASTRAALLCPIPLSPLGRFPTDDEVAGIAAWVARSEDRYLLLDGVYAYDFLAFARVLRPLLETARTIAFLSCTKSWLMPNTFGVALMTSTLQARLDTRSRHAAPSGLSRVAGWLSERPDLPRFQQQAFTREWRRLAPRIKAAAPTWEPPETGYFSVVDVPFETLLDRYEILAVPASVFGSSSRDHSMLACLHDLVAHERGDT